MEHTKIIGEGKKKIKSITINPDKQVVTLVTTKPIYKIATNPLRAIREDEGTNVEQVKTSGDDTFDKYIGVALALTYDAFGSRTKFRKFVDKVAKTVPSKSKKNN